jgi:outer membrane protein assembly factor BamA
MWFFILLFVNVSFVWSNQLYIQGNKVLSKRDIEDVINVPTNTGKWNVRAQRQWREQSHFSLITQYDKQGFFDVQVNIQIQRDTVDSKGWNIQIDIDEGPRYQFGQIRTLIQGEGRNLTSQVSLRTQKGKKFSGILPIRDKREIEKVYGNQGYANRQVRYEIRIDRKNKKVGIDFLIFPGKVILFDSLVVRSTRGQTGDSGLTDLQFVRDLLPLERGDTVRLSEVELLKAKLRSARIFYSIRLKDSLLVNDRSYLILSMKEKIPGSIHAALFYETDDGFGVESGWNHKNIKGQFYESRVVGRFAQNRQRFHLGWSNPLLYGFLLRWDNDLELLWRQLLLPEQDPFVGTLSSQLSHVRDFYNISSSLELVGRSKTVGGIGVDLNLISRLGLAWVDQFVNPTSGNRHSLVWGNGGSIIEDFSLDQLRHNWLEFQNAIYIPLFTSGVLGVRLDGGRFFGKGSDNAKRFYLGGNNSLRSRSYRTVFPLDSATGRGVQDPAYYLLSLEWRVKPFASLRSQGFWEFARSTQFVPFVDGGRIWSIENTNLSASAISTGLGVRIPISLFYLRLDYAVDWDGGPIWGQSRIAIDLAQAF